MKVEKRKELIERLSGGIHTISAVVDDLDPDAAASSPIVKSCFTKKIRGEHVYYLQLNPNKATNQPIISSYSQYKRVIDEFLKLTSAEGFRITRADFALDSGAEGDFLLFRKLNKLLISCIAEANKIKNCYESQELWSKQPLNIAIKNGYIEAESYDKSKESGGQSSVANRLELRSKRLNDDMVEEFTQNWPERLKQALNVFEAVQARYNERLIEDWEANQKKDRKEKAFFSVTSFVLGNKDRIFTRRQLDNLLDRIGAKNPAAAAKKLKNKHKIEFFSMTDLKVVVKHLIKIITEYFEN